MEYFTEKNAVRIAAELAVMAARTAPKSHGVDHFEIALTSAEEIKTIGEKMIEIGKEKAEELRAKGEEFENKAKATEMDWHSDGQCCGDADEILLIGMDARKPVPKNCGMCGYATCGEMLKAPVVENTQWNGPFCTNLVADLGIAVCSASSVLVRHHVDSRMFFKIGIAVKQLGLMPKCNCIIGVAMSATGKNTFFDRYEKLAAVAIQKGIGAY